MRNNILLTGNPGIGKSSVIQRILRRLGKDRIGGFWSGEIRKEGRRVGFSLETVDGDRGVLAHIDLGHGPRLGKYFVNVDDVESIAIPSLQRARDCGKIILIDEIAIMELFAPSFELVVQGCLDTRRVLGTIQQRDSPFLNLVRSRNDVTILEVTLSNRDHLPEQVLALL